MDVLVRDFLARDEQEASGLLELTLDLRQGPQTDLFLLTLSTGDDPLLAETPQILVQGDGAGLGFMDLQPLIVIGDDVMVRQSQEVVTMALIPVGHHLREVIPIAPIGMGM